MREIGQAFAAHDLPDGFHVAAEQVYARLVHEKDCFDGPTGAELARTLLDRGT